MRPGCKHISVNAHRCVRNLKPTKTTEDRFFYYKLKESKINSRQRDRLLMGGDFCSFNYFPAVGQEVGINIRVVGSVPDVLWLVGFG